MATTTRLGADPAEMRHALEVLFAPGQVIELRVPNAGRSGTIAGYFDDHEKLVQAAFRLNRQWTTYVTLNVVNPALLSRAANHVIEHAKHTTSDADVIERRWLPIDLDPVRPAGVSSTDEEHEAALARAREIARWVTNQQDWPAPIVADSGNGGHLLWRVALANDNAASELVANTLEALALRFSDEHVAIDTGVGNPARIWKLYGTVSRKGDDTPERPHRLARLLEVPTEIHPVPIEKLRALAALCPKPEPREQRQYHAGGNGRLDLGEWLRTHSVEVLRGPLDYSGRLGRGQKWVITCDRGHRDGAAIAVQFDSGAISVRCLHNSCAGWDWHALRESREPGYRDKKTPHHATHDAPESKASTSANPETTRDYGHAMVLARLFQDRYRWAVHRGSWMTYDGQVWRPMPEEAVAKAAADALREYYSALLGAAADKAAVLDLTRRIQETCVYARIMGALAFLRGWPGILTQVEQWDRDPWLLNCGNGTLDLRTCELRPHAPADLLTKLAPVTFDPRANGDRWLKHLERFLPNPNVRRQVQRDLGQALVGAVLEEVLPIWYGTGANGKTTTARVLLKVLGDYADRAAPNLLLQSKHDRHPCEVADLAGLRLAFSVEVEQGRRLAESLVKDLTGGDRKKARYMRQDFFSFEQTFSLILIVNHRPIVTGTDEGIWRRIRLVPWEYRIADNEKRPQEEVVAELVAEGPAILNWLLAGLRDWQADHGWVASEVQATTEDYRAEMDVLGDFIRERCVLGPRYSVPKSQLYEAYMSWCEATRERPLGRRGFTRRLLERGIAEARDMHTRRFVGIDLATEHDA